MVDGNESNGDVMTSDANGVGSWQAPAAIPSGMISMFDSVCPDGWAEVEEFRNKFPRGDDDGWCSAGGTGGSDTHAHTTSACTNNTSQTGAHTHAFCLRKSAFKCYPSGGGCTADGVYDAVLCVLCATGSAGDHLHTVSVGGIATDSQNNIPAFREVVFCKKD